MSPACCKENNESLKRFSGQCYTQYIKKIKPSVECCLLAVVTFCVKISSSLEKQDQCISALTIHLTLILIINIMCEMMDRKFERNRK